ncbi:MAG TPA: hypothetical protein VG270_05390 [Pseudolabrys sp.]|nr:hypothetical protein [Pseudolabrys sp.]
MLRRLLIPVAALVLAALAVVAVLQEMVANDQAAERRALLARNAELARAALAPGSALACLDGGAGEKVGDACEQDLFASPQAVAAAVALESARLGLLQAAFALSKHGDVQVMPAFADLRRAAELDRYGVAAHVLATRDGCTALKCDALAMFHDTTALRANLKAQAFEAYVARYAPHWGKQAQPTPPVAAAPQAAAPAAVATVTPAAPPHDTQGTARPVESRWNFPSADSIPPVSIMTPEPKLPKSAELPQPKVDPDLARSLGVAAAPVKKEEGAPRLPPERPKSKAAPAAAPR